MENIDKQVMLFSVVSFLHSAAIVKERSLSCKISEIDAGKEFFKDLRSKAPYLENMWVQLFPNIKIDDFHQHFSDIIKKAKAATYKAENKGHQDIKNRLKHLLSCVSISENKDKISYNGLSSFSSDSIFPNDNQPIQEENYYKECYNRILSKVTNAINMFSQNEDLFVFSTAVDSIIFRECSSIPAFIYAHDEISLYEYYKVVSAFASVMLKNELTNNNIDSFILLRADFFGIQNFIFNKTESSKYAAKILRGKSFYVSLMLDIASIMVLKSIGFTGLNIMMNAAGQFTAVFNNSEDTKLKIEELKKEVDNYLYHKYYGMLSLCFSYIECNIDDFNQDNFGSLLIKLLQAKENAKLTQFNLPIRSDFIHEDYNLDFYQHSLCKYCKIDVVSSSSEDTCDKCNTYMELGSNLASKKYIYIYEDSSGIFNKYSYKFSSGFSKENYNKAVYSSCIDITTDIDNNFYGNSIVHYKSYVKCHENTKNIKTFDELAENNNSSLLAVLKADVDNLGLIFSYGFADISKGEIIKNNVTFSKINILSRSIHNFFSYYLSHIMQDKGMEVYTIFAGGDDLCIVGDFNHIIDLAVTLQKDFNRFTSNNKDMSISIGISLFKSGAPIWFAVDEAENRLEQAKECENYLDKGNISILYSKSKISEFIQVYNDFNKLIDESRLDNDISKGIYYKLIDFCDMANEYTENKGNIDNLMWRSRLYYSISRSSIHKSLQEEFLKFITNAIDKNPLLFKSIIALKLYNLRNIKNI